MWVKLSGAEILAARKDWTGSTRVMTASTGPVRFFQRAAGDSLPITTVHERTCQRVTSPPVT